MRETQLRCDETELSAFSSKIKKCEKAMKERDTKGMAMKHQVNQRQITRLHSARPYESVKIFKGWPPRDAPSKLVQLWYKTFPPDRFLSGGNEEPN